jgi:YidC/Oxa1 family membrane protein insertase
MEMDKRSLLAIFLSIVIIVGWQFIFPPTEGIKTTDQAKKVSLEKDSIITEAQETKIVKPSRTAKPSLQDTESANKEYLVKVEDDLTIRELSSLNGVQFKNYYMKEHLLHGNGYVDLVNDSINNGFSAIIKIRDGREKDLKEVNFKLLDSLYTTVRLSESNPKLELNYSAIVFDKTIGKKITFHYNRYDYDISYDFSEIQYELYDNNIRYYWENGLPYTESVLYDDMNMSLVYMEGEDDFYRFDTSDNEEETFTDEKYFKYFSIRTKYFLTAVINSPENQEVKNYKTSQFAGKIEDVDKRNYDVEFKSPATHSSFKLFTGPYQSDILELYEQYNFDHQFFNASGYERLFRYISIPTHWFITKLYDYIGNYGVVIILFTIFIKLLLFPLTKKSYKGMKQMSALAPKMKEIKAKYDGDAQKIQQMTMKLYQQNKVNPLSGCLPMLMQMPLLLALFQIFRGSIELRGADFLWITDFASPDALYIGLGAIGFTTINLLPILMAASQIIMSKQTSASADPNQKAMVYIMPVVFLFMFYNWSAALNFYYLLFNVFTSIQQKFIHVPEIDDEKKEENPEGYLLNEKSKATKLIKNKKPMYKKKKD